MSEYDWKKLEEILGQHDPNYKEKVITETVIRCVIDDIQREKLQKDFERDQAIRTHQRIEDEKRRRREEQEAIASEYTISLLGSRNEHNQYQLPNGRWVSWEEAMEYHDQFNEPSQEDKLKDTLLSTIEKLDSEGKLPEDVKNLYLKK